MKKSFSRSLVDVLFGARTESAKKAKSVKLGMEMLEERQMLSVSQVSADDTVPTVESVASPSETPPISVELAEDAAPLNTSGASQSSLQHFKVDSGWNLDHYLSRTQGPIRFQINIPGKIDTTQPADDLRRRRRCGWRNLFRFRLLEKRRRRRRRFCFRDGDAVSRS